ncbi:MAG: hypothetical protein ACRDN9_02670 [Streptosporangiaceae bacterium]
MPIARRMGERAKELGDDVDERRTARTACPRVELPTPGRAVGTVCVDPKVREEIVRRAALEGLSISEIIRRIAGPGETVGESE